MEGHTDLYTILGLDKTVEISQETIRKAYHVKALACHPDKRHGDPNVGTEFLEVKKAFDILSVEASRTKYDSLYGFRKQNKVPLSTSYRPSAATPNSSTPSQASQQFEEASKKNTPTDCHKNKHKEIFYMFVFKNW